MRRLNHRHNSLKAGFTLIELLVSVVIMITLLGGGIAAYINFNDRQTVLNAAKEVQLQLRAAQIKARAAERPEGCDSLQAYAVRMNAGTNIVTTTAICANNEYPRDIKEINENVVVQDTFDIRFLVLHGGVTNPGTIVLVGPAQNYAIQVTQGGEINDGGYLTRE
jgi:prepilin-type N-terminal cleavage/methylation domain-containing protein